MKKLIFLYSIVGFLFSCNQTTDENSKMETAMSVYNQNAKAIHALFDSLENKDLEKAASFLPKKQSLIPLHMVVKI